FAPAPTPTNIRSSTITKQKKQKKKNKKKKKKNKKPPGGFLSLPFYYSPTPQSNINFINIFITLH
ncbi:hypothetical protein, partial [Klebsiella pneumoniae]|uniref:hypothetical protein n=1 Tax=Klebsiella pneumoniae TaxID=573 RepID=UPI001A9FF549